MALVLILVVGLLTLSSISLRTSQKALAQAAARANARMAMMLAIGDLQRYAGVDKAITATADMSGDATGAPVASGAAPANSADLNAHSTSLTAVQDGTRHWTGVWSTADVFPAIYTEAPYPRSSAHWLVSGQQGGSSITPAASSMTVGPNGQSRDPATTAILVSPAAGPDSAVSAPVVEISGKAISENAGRFAYWVGDEGVKARINSRAGYQSGTVATTQAAYSSPRRGWETVEGFSSYPKATADQTVVSLVTPSQIALLDSSLRPASSARGENFHDATADSFGVLTDTLQGGLRTDLTTLLRGDLGSSDNSRFLNYPKTNANIVPISVVTSLKGPKWDSVKAFRDLGARMTDGKLTVTQGDNITTTNIAPLITDLRLLLGARLVALDTTRYKINPCAKVAIALANPYAYPLSWDRDLELEIISDTPAGNLPSRIFDAAGQPAYLPQNAGEAAVFNNAIFVIPKGSLNPGEARAYTLGGSTVRPLRSVALVKVPLKEFGQTDPGNFNNCLEMLHDSVNTTDILLDVRESWTTSLATAILRVSGSGKNDFIRKVERFELDNGFYATVRRPVGSAISQKITKPFPLHCFSFQLSQPGAEYADFLPSRSLMGTRSSTQRTYMDYNLQARSFVKPIASYNPPPYFMESSDSLANLPFVAPGGQTGGAFTRNLVSSPLPWGRSPFGPQATVLFSPPRQLVSLAQLQHADLTADDVYISVGHQPGNAVGNSYSTPFVKRRNSLLLRSDYTVQGSPNPSGATTKRHNYYDIAYLLNTALWDSYFFSTLPESGQPVPLNTSLVVNHSNSSDLSNPERCAADLLVEGSFNINSTRKDAWKALLAGARQLRHPAQNGGSDRAAFPRSLEQPSGDKSEPTGDEDDSYSGLRTLTDEQIDLLATEITRQVRLRGPFMSLSQFVNRTLAPISSSQELGRCGALQAAIDRAGLNITTDGTKNAFENVEVADDRVRFLANGKTPRADLEGDRPTEMLNPSPPVWGATSKDLNAGAVASILADTEMLTDTRYRNEQGFRSTGIPGWLTQADVLQVIGPSLSARSDTFRIRGYGECLDPVTHKVIARAWCEAIVQRTPDFVDPANEPSTLTVSLNPVNAKFGRRFEIVSFHWLLPDEI